MKVKYDHRSNFSNLSNWFNGIQTRNLRTTRAILYQLSCEATHWERVNLLSLYLSWGMKWCEVYMKQFIFELRLWMKVKCDHRSKFSNLSNWKEEAWKNQGFNGIRAGDLRYTGAILYQLSYEATLWEEGQFIAFILLCLYS